MEEGTYYVFFDSFRVLLWQRREPWQLPWEPGKQENGVCGLVTGRNVISPIAGEMPPREGRGFWGLKIAGYSCCKPGMRQGKRGAHVKCRDTYGYGRGMSSCALDFRHTLSVVSPISNFRQILEFF